MLVRRGEPADVGLHVERIIEARRVRRAVVVDPGHELEAELRVAAIRRDGRQAAHDPIEAQRVLLVGEHVVRRSEPPENLFVFDLRAHDLGDPVDLALTTRLPRELEAADAGLERVELVRKREDRVVDDPAIRARVLVVVDADHALDYRRGCTALGGRRLRHAGVELLHRVIVLVLELEARQQRNDVGLAPIELEQVLIAAGHVPGITETKASAVHVDVELRIVTGHDSDVDMPVVLVVPLAFVRREVAQPRRHADRAGPGILVDIDDFGATEHAIEQVFLPWPLDAEARERDRELQRPFGLLDQFRKIDRDRARAATRGRRVLERVELCLFLRNRDRDGLVTKHVSPLSPPFVRLFSIPPVS